MTGRIPCLPDDCTIDAAHCGQPMVYQGGGNRWEGRLGTGTEIATARLACTVCTATAEFTVRTPS